MISDSSYISHVCDVGTDHPKPVGTVGAIFFMFLDGETRKGKTVDESRVCDGRSVTLTTDVSVVSKKLHLTSDPVA